MGKRKKSKSGAAKPVPPLGLKGGLQLLLFFVTVCGLAAVAAAQVLFANQTFHRHGVIAAVDALARSLTVQTGPAGRRVTYAWNEHTVFLDGAKRVEPEAVVPGTKVAVDYRAGFFTPDTAVRVRWTARTKAAGP